MDFNAGTFTRATDAIRRTSPDGSTVELVGVDVLRFEDRGDGAGSLVFLEKAHTNALLRTEALNLAGWAKLNCSVAKDVISPLELANDAFTLTATAGGSEVRLSSGQRGAASWSSRHFYVYLRAGTVATASIAIHDGTSIVATQDLVLDSTWRRYEVRTLLSGSARGNCYIRPHHAAATPSAGDSIQVWGPMMPQGQISVHHPGSYVETVNPAEQRGNERLELAIGQYDARVLSEPFWFYWVPDFALPGDAYPDDTSFLSFGGPAEEILYANNDDRVRLRTGAGPSDTHCNTTPLTFSRGQVMRVQVDPPAGTVEVIGATTGGAPDIIGSPFSFASSAVRIGGRFTDVAQHNLDGRMSVPFLGRTS
ncbi:MAG: hypothetical protein AAGD14_12670 [Planctomycetota bacterium]